jgi:hypothetical protein
MIMEPLSIAVLVFDVLAIAVFLFIVMNDKISLKACEHKNTFTAVDNTVVTCETTTITCLDCGKRLSTKTDC